MIYYGLFESVLSNGLPNWGSANETIIIPLIKLQHKVLKILKYDYKLPKNIHNINFPMEFNKLYNLLVLRQHYTHLKNQHMKSESKTRKKEIKLPKITLEVGKKASLFKATAIYNNLKHEFKILNITQKSDYLNLKDAFRN